MDVWELVLLDGVEPDDVELWDGVESDVWGGDVEYYPLSIEIPILCLYTLLSTNA